MYAALIGNARRFLRETRGTHDGDDAMTVLQFGRSRAADIVSCVVLSLLTGFVIGAGDLDASSPTGTLLVLLASSATLGAVFPRYPLVVAAVIGLAVPLAHLLAKFNGWPVEGDRPNMWWTLIGLGPSLIGAFAGSLLRGLVALRGGK
ncbi:MAG: hypothetical protein JNM94_17995 [Phycisphaerae bacterium]|nr:hypothetical protein [Phycisphaerae bacterium]